MLVVIGVALMLVVPIWRSAVYLMFLDIFLERPLESQLRAFFFAGRPPDLEHPSAQYLCHWIEIVLRLGCSSIEAVDVVIVVSLLEGVNDISTEFGEFRRSDSSRLHPIESSCEYLREDGPYFCLGTRWAESKRFSWTWAFRSLSCSVLLATPLPVWMCAPRYRRSLTTLI